MINFYHHNVVSIYGKMNDHCVILPPSGTTKSGPSGYYTPIYCNVWLVSYIWNDFWLVFVSIYSSQMYAPFGTISYMPWGTGYSVSVNTESTCHTLHTMVGKSIYNFIISTPNALSGSISWKTSPMISIQKLQHYALPILPVSMFKVLLWFSLPMFHLHCNTCVLWMTA